MPPHASQAPMPQRPPQKESAGPIVGAIIVVILLIVGGIYFWSTRLNHQSPQQALPLITGDTSTTADQ